MTSKKTKSGPGRIKGENRKCDFYAVTVTAINGTCVDFTWNGESREANLTSFNPPTVRKGKCQLGFNAKGFIVAVKAK